MTTVREWKPGDVALIEVGCAANRHRGMYVADDGWRYGADQWVTNDPAIATVHRPLVVIDPDSLDDWEALAKALVEAMYEAGDKRAAANGIMPATVGRALKTLVDPKPPRPEEPRNLGAAVEDTEGRVWLRGRRTLSFADWIDASGENDDRQWGSIDAVKVLSDGIPA